MSQAVGPRKAFTLIELLIVVAIIAILAAIAVPNFLEAQVRAKVSRAQADMRTLATSLESYAVDYNRVPLSAEELEVAMPPKDFEDYDAYCRMTTPVAYMTSIPMDPFGDKGTITVNNQLLMKNRVFEYKTFAWSPNLIGKASGGYGPQVGVAGSKFTPLMRISRDRGYGWSLASVGPTRSAALPENRSKLLTAPIILSANYPLYLYDPSNGTVSFGWVLRTNKGVLTGSDWQR